MKTTAGYDAEIRIDTKIDTSQMQRLQIQIDKTENKVAALSAKLSEVGNKQINTSAFAELEVKLQSAQAELDKLIVEENKMASTGLDIGAPWDSLIQKQADARLRIEDIMSQMQKLKDTEKAFTLGTGTDEYRKIANDLMIAKSEMSALTTKQDELFTKVPKVTSGFDKMAKSAKGAFRAANKGAKTSNGLLSTLGTRLKGIALSLLIFNWITKGFNTMVNGIKEGFGNLTKYSDEYKKSVTSLKNANTQMKNSFATAFAPIVTAAIPHLVNLIGYVTTAANYVAQFMAVLSGRTTWTKAKGIQAGYADSLDKTAASAKKAAGALASFDTLEVLNKKDSGGSGGGMGDMFEEVEIDSGIVDSVNKFKSLLEGLAEAAQPAIDAFKKLWDEGLSKLKDFTFGTLSDFYNSFLVPVGKWMLGEGLPRFFKVTNDLLNEINWERLRTSLDAFYTVLGKLAIIVLDGLLDFYEYFLKPLAVWTMSSAIPQIVDILTDFINKVDWEKINKSLERFWKAIEPYAEQFGQGLIDFFSDMKDIGVVIMNAIPTALDAITKALNKGDPEKARDWGYALGEIALAFTALKLASKGFESVTTTLKSLSGLMPYAVFAVAIAETAPNIKFPDPPKEEDYKSLEEYNVALENFQLQLNKILENPLELPVVETNEDGWNKSLVDIYDKLVAWCDDVDNLVLGDKIGGAFEGTWADTGKRFAEWWDRDVTPWFTTEKWSALGIGVGTGFSEWWIGVKEWWNTSTLVLWWEESVVPWFTSEKWSALGQGILDGISEKWNELVTWWTENVGAWWTENVDPWFSKETWSKIGTDMKDGLYNGFKAIVGKIVGILNSIIGGFEGIINGVIDGINALIDMFNSSKLIEYAGFSIDRFDHVDFKGIAPPALANGAVLRGGNPFMAILGDQPAGQTNIETPLKTMIEAFNTAMDSRGGSQSGTPAVINLNINGETFARATLNDFMSELNRQGYDLNF